MDVLAPRYADLLASLPQGSFYDADGVVVPWTNAPYELRLTTDSAATTYSLFVNDIVVGEATTDADSSVLVTVILKLGRNVITLTRSGYDSKTLVYITARHTATYHAAHADALQIIDDNIDQVKQNQYLATVNPDSIDQIWARRLRTQNTPNYPTSTYRSILQQLQQAYRYYGGTESGLMSAVAAFTGMSPMLVPFAESKRWLLGEQLIPNPSFTDMVWDVTESLASLNALGIGISIIDPHYYIDDVLNVTWNGTGLDVGGSVYGIDRKSGPADIDVELYEINTGAILTNVGPYDTSVRNLLTLDLGRGPITFTLTSSATLGAAQLLIDINAGLTADSRYVSIPPSTLNLGCVTIYPMPDEPTISILPSRSVNNDYNTDAAINIFNIPIGRTTCGAATFTGYTTAVSVASVTGFNVGDDALLFSCVVAGPATKALTVKVTAIGTTTLTLDASAYTGICVPTQILSGTIICNATQYPASYNLKTPRAKFTVHVEHPESFPTSGPAVSGSITVSPVVNRVVGWVVSPGPTTGSFGNFWINQRSLGLNSAVLTTATTIVYGLDRWAGRTATLHAVVSPQYTGTASSLVLEISYDNVTWTSTTPFNVPFAATPVLSTLATTIPYDATMAYVRLRVATVGAAGSAVFIERVTFTVDSHHALFLGTNTIVRNQHRAKRGSTLYVWCPDVLTAAEQALLGLPQGARGHIDTISPAHVVVDRVDMSGGSNVVGISGAAALAACTLVNMEVVAQSPDRLSYLRPTTASRVVGEVVYPLTVSPYTFGLAHPINVTSAVYTVYENGVPVVASMTSVTDATTLNLTYAPDTTKVYTVDYDTVIQATSSVIELPADYATRPWYGNYATYSELYVTPQSVPIVAGIQFDATYKALLKVRSDQDKATTTLSRDDGRYVTVVPEDQWGYIDATTVSISPNQFDANNLYTLTYVGRVVHPVPRQSTLAEVRQAATSPNVLLAPWTQYEINQPLAPMQFCQFRITLSNVIG
jgi:hypothetical protein